MQSAIHTKVQAILIFMMLVLCGCDNVFEYHPYDTLFEGAKYVNASNIGKIETGMAGRTGMKFAFISDNHIWYTSARRIVDDINSRTDIDFVIHGGDLTDCGTAYEYVKSRDILQTLNVPFVALIGNHDFLGTGDQVYKKMFGELDFSFIAGDVKFVCLNTNATEYDYLAAVPNFDYMEAESKADSDRWDRTVVCMHARPGSEQFNNNVRKTFQYMVRNFPGLLFCLNGHDHALQIEDLHGDGVMYYGAPSANKLTYFIFTITPDGYEYEIVEL